MNYYLEFSVRLDVLKEAINLSLNIDDILGGVSQHAGLGSKGCACTNEPTPIYTV